MTRVEPGRRKPRAVLATERLVLRRFTVADAPFILVLLNDPAWLEFIGDKGVRTLEDARDYLRNGPIAMYEREGFGLYLVERKRGRHPDRHVRPDQARVPRGRGHRVRVSSGPSRRRATRTRRRRPSWRTGTPRLGLERIVAITSPGNARSAALLEKLGMTLEKTVMLDGHDHEVRLYASRS